MHRHTTWVAAAMRLVQAGRHTLAPQCPWCAMRPQSQAVWRPPIHLRQTVLALALVVAAALPTRAAAVAAQSLPAGALGRRVSAADPRAVATARAFMAAFVRRDYQGKVRLMSVRLTARNHSATVAQLLGVRTIPQRVDVVSATNFASATGARTVVVVALRFGRTTVLDSLTVIKTARAYLIDKIDQGVVSLPLYQSETLLAYFNAIARHDGATEYRFTSFGRRQALTAQGITDALLSAQDRAIRALSIVRYDDVTPGAAPDGAREYRVVLNVRVAGASSWKNGVDVRYVTVVRGVDTPWAIAAVSTSLVTLGR